MPDWKIKRDDTEFAAPDAATLRAWATEGRVQESDYVFNPVLERWMYARDLEELAGTFHAQTAAKKKRLGCQLSILGLLLCLLFWPLGILVLAGGLVVWGVADHHARKEPTP